MNKFYANQLVELETEMCTYKDQVTAATQKLETQKATHQKKVDDMLKVFYHQKDVLRDDLGEWKSIVQEELRVREKVQEILIEREKKYKEEISTLKQIILIPRTHFKNLEKMKYEDLVKQKDKILNKTVSGNNSIIRTSRQSKFHTRAGSTTLTEEILEHTPPHIKFPHLRKRRSRMRNISQIIGKKPFYLFI